PLETIAARSATLRGADLLPNESEVLHGPNLDAACPRPGKRRADPHGFVHVVRLDEIEARDDLLRFGERSVVNGLLPISNAHRFGRRRRPKNLRVEQPALFAQVVGVLDAPAHRFAELARAQLFKEGLVTVYENQELHRARR